MTPIEVLLAEDDPEDVELTREMLRKSALSINLSVVRDGIEAMRYLRKQASYAEARRPDLILLDLNMPRKDGREVLQEIKSDPGLKDIPVAILTTSSSEKDVEKCSRLGAGCFITKPVGLGEFPRAAKQMDDFWAASKRSPASA